MTLTYSLRRTLSVDAFIDLLERSTLAARRPVNDPKRIAAMLRHADLLCTAWDGAKPVGVARSVTDFSFCCYMSDLAVDQAYQGRGIGQALVRRTQACLAPGCRIILLAAPLAETYYPRIGFSQHRSAWTLGARDPVG
jgi:predicted GNAT family acetyltransferase